MLPHEGDDGEGRLAEGILRVAALLGTVSSVGVGALMAWAGARTVAYGLWVQSAWYAAFAALTASLGSRRTMLFLLPAIVAGPLFEMWASGGFGGPNGAIPWTLWTLLGPMGAVFFLGQLATILALAACVLGHIAVLVAERLVPAAAPALGREVVSVLVVTHLALFSSLAVLAMLYFMQNRARLLRELAREHARSERLLGNVLPASIARRLKDVPLEAAAAGDVPYRPMIADHHPAATILFADVVGFTQLATRLGAEELVRLLDDIFSAFDALAERYGLEKIKTIGDAYLVVGGLPDERPDHAEAVAAMALDMLSVVSEWPAADALDIRIGIHTGEVVAGVIGRRKFAYDLWGDAVNIASRMESHGAAGAIQISEATAAILEGRFVIEPRGAIDIKGKGAMRTFWLRAPIRSPA